MSRLRPALALWMLICGSVVPAAAQKAQSSLDAVILAQPMGPGGFASGQILVAVDFPRLAPHASVRQRMQSLAAAGGWAVQSLDIADRKIQTGGGYAGVQTEATAILSGVPAWQNGAFRLQPFVEAFKDLGRFRVLFMAQADPAFRGLREFESPALSVRMNRGGGPYDYAVQVRSHAGPLPALPLTQSPAPAPQQPPASAARSSAAPFAMVVAIAAVVGLLVLAAMLLRLRVRSASPSDAHPHSGTRS